MSNFLNKKDIAIVGVGCVLPLAKNYNEFKNVLFEGHSIISEIAEDRWKKELFYSENKNEECLTYSDLAAQISFEIYQEIKEKHNLCHEYDARLICYVVESFFQVISDIKNLTNEKMNIPLILGCMNPDVRFLEEHVYLMYKRREHELRKIVPPHLSIKKLLKIHDEMIAFSSTKIDDAYDESIFQTYVFKRVAEKFSNYFQGRGFLVDAACASSLSALDIACNQLITGQEDFVIAGGIESNLSAGTFVVFSRVGALTNSTSLKPLDEKSSGMIQGEGCTLFALERLEDAINNKRNIYGIIKGVSGSSDGRSASLFQPTKNGQMIAYERVWKHLQDKPFFIEAHATGTSVGDATETESITEYFSGQKLHVGAIKGQFGHTKGNAGAISLLKSIAIFENNIIPGNRGVVKSRFEGGDIVVNSENVPINEKSKMIGISSFGFGGCNYHLALERALGESTAEQLRAQKEKLTLAVISKTSVMIDDIDLDHLEYFPFPPKSLPNIDIFQIAAVIAVNKLFSQTEYILDSIGRRDMNVVSCGKLGLNKNIHLVNRVANKVISTIVDHVEDSPEKEFYIKYTQKYFNESIALSEDIGPGILNNVIAGRISNVFDLNGKNYHIDKDFDSLQAGLYTIGLELAIDRKKVFIVIDTVGDYNSETKEYEEKRVDAYIVTHPDNIHSLGLGKIEEFEIEKL